ETVRGGLNGVGPSKVERAPAPGTWLHALCCEETDLIWRLCSLARTALAAPRSASGGPSRTPRPTGCLL
ncbi:Uncharacterized protein APZ42_003886, partial [Daphnia magna]